MLIGNGIDDDAVALQALLNEAGPHGTVLLPPCSTFRVCIGYATPHRGLAIPQGVTLDLNGSNINLELDNDVYGVRLMDGARLLGDHGKISVTTSTNLGSSQSLYHTPVSLGAALSEIQSPTDQGPFHNAKGWIVSDVELATCKPYGHHLAAIGGVHHGLIEDLIVGDNANAHGAINFDWGTVGPTGTIPQNRAAFNTGNFFTVHPHNISITRCRIGTLANENAEAIRLSGCSGIRVHQAFVKYAGGAGFAHYGGDFGFEFAPAGPDRYRAFMNTTVRDLEVDGTAATGSAVRIDALADNIAREAGYVPLWKPVYDTNLMIDGLYANAVYGTGIEWGPSTGVTVQRARINWCKTGIKFGSNVTRGNFRDCSVYGLDSSSVYYTGNNSGVAFVNSSFGY